MAKKFPPGNKTGICFHLSLFLTNKQQGDKDHSGVNQTKTLIKARMLKSLAGCRTMFFFFAVFCEIGALERNAY